MNTGEGRGSNLNSRKNLKKFKPGQSGNPKGRPSNARYVSEALRELLAEGKTGKEAMVDALARNLAKRALRSSYDLNILLDRTEGKVTQPIVGAGGGPLVLRVVYDNDDGIQSPPAKS